MFLIEHIIDWQELRGKGVSPTPWIDHAPSLPPPPPVQRGVEAGDSPLPVVLGARDASPRVVTPKELTSKWSLDYRELRQQTFL